jgi:hypothetical protein
MFRQICVTAIMLAVVCDAAMKKSWKSAANFDDEIPKFTPFENSENLETQKLDEVQMKTTKTPTSSPSLSETMPGKMSSKIRAPSKHVAEMFNQFQQEVKKNSNQDFGAFNANLAAQAAQEDRFETIADEEQLDIEQVLSQLTDDAKVSDDSTDNSEDELEITPIGNYSNTAKYKVGPLMNVTIDSEDSLVNVNLDQNTLKEIFTGSGSWSLIKPSSSTIN